MRITFGLCFMDHIPDYDLPQSSGTPSGHPLRAFFRAVTGRAFDRFQALHDPAVEDHISDGILAEFVHVDRIHPIRDEDGQAITELSELSQRTHNMSPQCSGFERDLEVHQHVGDYALYMAGIFPEHLERHASHNPMPLLACVGSSVFSMSEPVDFYIVEGRSAYSHVSKLYRALDETRSGVFHRLSNRFEDYLELMGLIRDFIRDQARWDEVDWDSFPCDEDGGIIT